MVTLHEVITFLVSMQISISSLQTHNVNRCGRSRHLARKLSLRRKRSSPNVFEMAATETITSIILIKLIRVSLRSEERRVGKECSLRWLRHRTNDKTTNVINFCFFKQKTAYEIGLGIPAEPLFRSISSLQTHNVNRCGRSRHLARKLSLRRKRSSPNVFEMAATETITSIILIKLIRVSLGTVRHPRDRKSVV